MRTIKRRIEKLEGGRGEQLSAWLKQASPEEIEARCRKILAKITDSKPEEIDLSLGAIKTLLAEVKVELDKGGLTYVEH